MLTVVEIINQITATSSRNEKESILKANHSNELLKKVLQYTYDPFKRYKVTEKTIKCDSDKISFLTIFDLMDLLAANNINDNLREEVNSFLSTVADESLRQLYTNMLLKDLRCNISEKTINKIWKGLIPSFSCMLGSKYTDHAEYVDGKTFILTTKLDGFRILAIKENDNVKFFTRQGQEYEGLHEIEQDLLSIELDNFVLDGELLVSNYKEIPPETRYKSTSKIARKDGDKAGLTMVAFDLIFLEDFKQGISTNKYVSRRALLESLIDFNLSHIEPVEKLYQGNDTRVIQPIVEEAVAKGEEGIMLNIANAPYECKRTKNLLKVKLMQTADVRVVGIEEGTGQNKGRLGAIEIEFEYDNTTHRCFCGSGFSQEERITYYNNPELIINKIVEIRYFEVTTNQKGGVGLRFPVWAGRIRHDKSEISMY